MKEELSDEDIITALREVYIKDMLREEERRIQKRQKTIRMLVSALAVAAVLVVGIFVLRVNHQQNYSTLADNYVAQIEEPSVSRGDNDLTDRYFAVVSSLKNNKSTVLADIGAFYAMIDADRELDQDERDFYTINMNYFEALAHLRNNDFAKAEPLLRKVSESKSQYAEAARTLLSTH